MLTILIFIPILGALIIPLIRNNSNYIKFWALIITGLELLISVFMLINFDLSKNGYQFVESYEWIPSLGISYHLGVDGLSLPLVFLTTLLFVCAISISIPIKTRVAEYFFWFLVLETSVLGVFVSLDLVLFFIFWELELIPMYFIISVWGSGNKEYSAMKFVIYTLLGSAFMLVGLLITGLSVGNFNIEQLSTITLTDDNFLVSPVYVFIMFFVAFAIKLPSWPLHSWLPDAHTDAPTAGSVILAGVLIKMGGYGIIRICVQIFQQEAKDLSLLLVFLGAFSLVYGAIITFRQTDIKKLIAFSSVSHMGIVLLGISAYKSDNVEVASFGLEGAALQMFTHGTITGLLFLSIGLIYDRLHTREIKQLQGLVYQAPIISLFFVIASMASLGLPGLSGFVAEVTVFMAAFAVWNWFTVISVFSIVLTAGYMLWLVQRVIFGDNNGTEKNLPKLSSYEYVPALLLVISIIAIGVYPNIIFEYFEQGVIAFVNNTIGV
ncbi:MAG: NADH-quinone oxidoreductase subunit M [SAR202 cluster bacterium]|nr:oxidoreductase [Chloroflexota bacterium]MQG50481.1 NADH-quinone oxidoreductase subunit M [SAR202 cluster bacterium]|tara:strand:- start:10533 stop:12011 length:1479 start_codon:yes stop_codon:yes gene_type:complete